MSKIIYLRADPKYFNPAMFSQDLLHNSNDGSAYQVITLAEDNPTLTPLLTYITPDRLKELVSGALGQSIIVAEDLANYAEQSQALAEKKSTIITGTPRKAIAVMAVTGLHVFLGYGDVWRFVSVGEAFKGNELSVNAFEAGLGVGDAAFIAIDSRGNWHMDEKPMGHVYRKETDVPEEVVRHILVEEILKSYDIRTH